MFKKKKERCSFTWGNQYTSDCQHLVSKRIKSSVYYNIDDWAPRPEFDSISGEREGTFLRLMVMLLVLEPHFYTSHPN